MQARSETETKDNDADDRQRLFRPNVIRWKGANGAPSCSNYSKPLPGVWFSDSDDDNDQVQAQWVILIQIHRKTYILKSIESDGELDQIIVTAQIQIRFNYT